MRNDTVLYLNVRRLKYGTFLYISYTYPIVFIGNICTKENVRVKT